MSDLIIKPSGTNANFKVQNPSGTDKIVMNSSGTITTGTLGSGVTFPTGMVLRVFSSSITDRQTNGTNGSTPIDLTGTDQNGSGSVFCVKITPISNSSNILCLASGVISITDRYNRAFVNLVRDSTTLGVGDAATGHEVTTGYCPRGSDSGYYLSPFSINFLDSPSSTSELTYKLQLLSSSTGMSAVIGGPGTVDANGGNSSTNLTVMEIAG